MKTKQGIDDINDITDNFKPQHEPLQCLPTCIMNIHNELFKRKGKDEKISLSDSSELCGFIKHLGSNEHFLVEKINERIKKYNYQAREEYYIKDEMEFLEKVLVDQRLSFPIVTLSGKYWSEISSTRGPSERKLAHSVIVLGLDQENVIYYEPAENFISSFNSENNNPRKLIKPRFQELWEDYEEPTWLFWYEPRKTRILEDFLEEDDERRREYNIQGYRSR